MTAVAAKKPERPLRFFSISDGGRSDRSFYVAGYTIADCCVLLSHAMKHRDPQDNPYSEAHLRTYGSSAWGSSTERLERKRGVYLVEGSLHWKDQSGTKITFIEPPAHIPAHVPNASPSEAAALQPVPEDYGKLRSQITKRAKLDEWTFDSPHLKDRAKFSATIYLIKGGYHFRGRIVDREAEFSFLAESEVFEDIVATDIEKLRTKVTEAFQLYDLGQRGIVWEDWFEVVVTENSPYHYERKVLGAGFSIRYRRLKRGVHPKTGKPLTINNNHVVTDFPKPKAAKKRVRDREDADFEEHDDRDAQSQYAYIPATPANEQALDSIANAIDAAYARVQNILGQAAIEQTLAALPTVPLLEEKKP